MHTRAMRVLRGSLAALFATCVAALSHVVAGGVSPSLFGVAVSLLISITICSLLAGRTVSLLRLSIAILASQTLYHALFSSMLAPAGVAAHDMSAMTFNFASVANAADSTMSLWHVAAAVVTIVVFRYAEVAFWGLLATARLLIARLLGAASLTTVQVLEFRIAPRTAPATNFMTRILSTTRYRGPPATLFAV